MGFLSNKYKWIKTALKNDAKTLIKDTSAQSAPSPKLLLLGSGVLLAVALGVSGVSAKKISKPTNKNIAENTTKNNAGRQGFETLYDLRTLAQKTDNITKKTITIKSGQSLGPLLQKNGLSGQEAYLATKSMAAAFSPKNLRAGQKVNLYFNDKNDFYSLSFKPDINNTVFVTRSGDNEFSAKKITAEFKKELVKIDTEINNSLYLDAQKLGAPDKVIVQFSQIYAHSVDFQRDIRQGDKFAMLFEVFRDHKGNVVKAGDLIYTSFSPRGKTSEYYLFEKSNGREGYYDAKGNGAKRMLMRTPINGARLTSRYGYRKHPIKGYRKKHKGVDFGAPRGTPIMAGGTGVITHAGRYGGYGNYVRIRHSDGYSTAYAHMKGFARGIRKGKRVRQGQTIGYVGSTGLSTGPHLHYEVLKNGRHINPMRLSTLTGKPLPKPELPKFKQRVKQIKSLYKQAGSALIEPYNLQAENKDKKSGTNTGSQSSAH